MKKDYWYILDFFTAIVASYGAMRYLMILAVMKLMKQLQ
jgi:hypothetical protein